MAFSGRACWLLNFKGVDCQSLGILAHRTSDDEQGVYSHLRNERYLGSITFLGNLKIQNVGNFKKLVEKPPWWPSFPSGLL